LTFDHLSAPHLVEQRMSVTRRISCHSCRV